MVDFHKARLTRYVIGDEGAYFMHGPDRFITEMLDMIPKTNPAFIFKITPEGEIVRLYRWRPGTEKWVRIRG